MGARVVGDELRLARADEIGKAQIEISIAGCNVSMAASTSSTVYGAARGGRLRPIRKANSGSPTRISLPFIGAAPPSAITVSLMMRPAMGPATLMCFCPASLVAAIFQPNNLPLDCRSSAAWMA